MGAGQRNSSLQQTLAGNAPQFLADLTDLAEEVPSSQSEPRRLKLLMQRFALPAKHEVNGPVTVPIPLLQRTALPIESNGPMTVPIPLLRNRKAEPPPELDGSVQARSEPASELTVDLPFDRKRRSNSKRLHWFFTFLLIAATTALFIEQILRAQ